MSSTRLVAIAAQIMAMAIIATIVVLFIGIGVLVLMHACVVGRAFRCGLRTMTRREQQQQLRSSAGLSPEELEKIPWYEYNNENPEVECAVCLEKYELGDKCRRLPSCNHCFHMNCVDFWLSKTSICPICRTNLVHIKSEKVQEMELPS